MAPLKGNWKDIQAMVSAWGHTQKEPFSVDDVNAMLAEYGFRPITPGEMVKIMNMPLVDDPRFKGIDT